ncbi:hypothetical protein HISP_16085 [Haloarcula hispanica N601]|uniref:Uncharacterized protein n=2 Tax=Haloarcula hispanica TaxID=51589 RepID=V5TQN1_HALHI|nr:conserved hypothetical protein [Haloarcula hispanica ATCC 33960]AHB67591.1 hypothetical protein HISP_16085 [Haloarcula hispanica N601]
MSTEQQSVDEQSPSTDADNRPDIRSQHQRAQTSGEVFAGRSRGGQ